MDLSIQAFYLTKTGKATKILTAGQSALAKSSDRQIVKGRMDPYANPDERKVGAKRPKISHLPRAVDPRTRSERQAEKQAVESERRAIKKSARRHLKQALLRELDEAD
jgi:hypothetical protein